MGKFRRSNKIFRNFWFEDVHSKVYEHLIIYEPNESNRIFFARHIPTAVLALSLVIMCAWNMYYLMKKESLNLYESIGIPASTILATLIIWLWMEIPKTRSYLSNAINRLQIMDEILSKYLSFSKTQRRVNHLINLLTVITIIYQSHFIFFVILFFISPFMKSFLIVGISICTIVSLPLYLVIIRLLFKDRLNVLKTLMNILIPQSTLLNNCHWCNGRRKPNLIFCEKHKIK